MACEGVYADVQSGEEGLHVEIDEGSAGRILHGKRNKGEELGREKLIWIVNKYKESRTDFVRHFKFNSSANVVPFGKNYITFFKVVRMMTLRRGAASIHLGACPGLL